MNINYQVFNSNEVSVSFVEKCVSGFLEFVLLTDDPLMRFVQELKVLVYLLLLGAQRHALLQQFLVVLKQQVELQLQVDVLLLRAEDERLHARGHGLDRVQRGGRRVERVLHALQQRLRYI